MKIVTRSFIDVPHVYGEYTEVKTERTIEEESPPYTWGIHGFAKSLSHLLGITPIHMGNTEIKHCSHSFHKDHPHTHGEYNTRIKSLEHEVGSPPYTWGILCLAAVRSSFSRDHPHTHGEYPLFSLITLQLYRITPIHMGNTPLASSIASSFWDHPHTHGEYADDKGDKALNLGSPPYTWGILVQVLSQPFWKGITPIHMGNTKRYLVYNGQF